MSIKKNKNKMRKILYKHTQYIQKALSKRSLSGGVTINPTNQIIRKTNELINKALFIDC